MRFKFQPVVYPLLLLAKEKQYRRIIETSEEGIWLLDPQGRTTFANH